MFQYLTVVLFFFKQNNFGSTLTTEIVNLSLEGKV